MKSFCVALVFALGATATCASSIMSDLLASIAVNNTVIIAQVNCGYLEFAANWIYHAKQAGVRNYILVAEDENAYDYIKGFDKQVVRASTMSDRAKKSSSRLTHFGTIEHGELNRHRAEYMSFIIRKGFSVILTDLDAVLLKDPLPYVPLAYDFVGVQNVNPVNPISPLNWEICTCFMYVRPTEQGTRMLNAWSEACEGHKEDQTCFNTMYYGSDFKSTSFILPPQLFPTGACLKDFDKSILRKWNSPLWVHSNFVNAFEKRNFLKSFNAWVEPERPPPSSCE
jgi:Nucleotide-diphospho-sugar transferase